MNKERNAEIIRRRKAGDKPVLIAHRMGISRNIVAGVLDRASVCERRGGRADDAFRQVVANAYLNGAGLSQTEVAREWGVSQTAVSNWSRRISK